MNKGYKGLSVNVTDEVHKQIKDYVTKHNLTISRLIMECLGDRVGFKEDNVRYGRRVGTMGTEPPEDTGLREQNVYYCPFCKRVMEETDRRDRIDRYGENHYHSCDIQLECSACNTGHSIVLNLPYRD